MSEILEDRRFWIAIVAIIVTLVVVYTATTIYQIHLSWLAALEEGIPFTTDWEEIRDWFGLVVGYPIMIVLMISLYLYVLLMFVRARGS
jgi:hypothetical protein